MPDSDNESSSRAQGEQTASSTTGGSRNRSNNNRTGLETFTDYVKSNFVDFALAVTRTITVLCTISYLIGFPGPSANRFRQALSSNAATSFFRLQQRRPMPPYNQLGHQYFLLLASEDSMHYLIFSLTFLVGRPITLALLPCVLYAVFNLARYAIDMLDKFGDSRRMKPKISDLITKYQQSLLHTVALSEITLMPVTVVGMLTGSVSTLVPFVYLAFLNGRYNSTRNAHLKLLVSQIQTVASTQIARFRGR